MRLKVDAIRHVRLSISATELIQTGTQWQRVSVFHFIVGKN
jgi:hypothetical protein